MLKDSKLLTLRPPLCCQSQLRVCKTLVAWLHGRYRPDFHEAPQLLGRLKRMGGSGRSRSSAYVDPRDIQGCEALLEAHFTQVCLL